MRKKEEVALAVFREQNIGVVIPTSSLCQIFLCIKEQYAQRLQHTFSVRGTNHNQIL